MKVKVLTSAEVAELVRAMHAGDARARHELAERNLALVQSIANKFQGRGLDLEDLVAEGTVGLLRAIDKFEPERGLRFSTYATHCVRGFIQRAISNTGRTIRLPAYLSETAQRERAFRAPKVVSYHRRLRSEDGELLQLLAAKAPQPDVEARQNAARDHVRLLLLSLSARERKVLSRRFGLGGRGVETLAAVGEDLGVSRERVRQLETRAMRRLGAE